MIRNIKSRSNSESGYTMQTLIIIAILVLAATTAAALLYAILRDSTGRIAGGSETFDGLPSGPQNLQVESVPSGSDVVVTISWEAPSYLGEFPPTGYDPSINKDGTPDTSSTNSRTCDEPLETSNENFTYDNRCRFTVSSFDSNADYELLFTINLGSADTRYSPGGLTFYRELDLSIMTDPPSQVETSSLPDALAVSWEAVPNVIYRLHAEWNGNNYYQCFNSRGGQITREIPNIRDRAVIESTTLPPDKQQLTVMLSPASSSTLTLNLANCSTDSNFGREISFTGSFGTPSPPDIRLETDLTRTVTVGATTEMLPSLKATLASCPTDSSTTFFWEVAGQPLTQKSHTSDCALTTTIYEDFALDTEYEVWAVAENSVGTSSPSERQRWLPTLATTSLKPGPPQNINAVSEGSGILVSWDAPSFIPDAGIRGYILRTHEKLSGTACFAASIPASSIDTPDDISADTSQYRLDVQENLETHCFQLSAFSIDSSQAEQESEIESFEAVYVNPLSIGIEEFLLNWHPDPRAEYYTISWAPLTSDTTCVNDPTAVSLQPSNFLSATIPFNGEGALTYTIPAIRNTYYLVRSAATLTGGATVSWQRHICTNLYNAPTVATPTWTGTATAGTPIGIQWAKPDETAASFYTSYGPPYSYALLVTHTSTTTPDEYRCIPFSDTTSLTETVDASGTTMVSIEFIAASVAGDYGFSLTVAPSGGCNSNADAMSIIDSPPAAAPPVQTGSITVA